MCVEKKTVRPAFASSAMMSRTSFRPIGSSPLIGSSRMSSSGSCTSAAASPTRWSIPFESARTARSIACPIPTRSRIRSTFVARSFPRIPLRRPHRLTNSRGDRYG